MRKFLTTGLFGAILGLLVGAPADASLISRSFLDEALTSYATTTALDLKANKADLTDLSDKIGDAWPYGSDMGNGLYNLSWQLYPPEITLENVSDLVRFLFGGALESGINQGGVLNLLGESVFYTGAYDINTGQIDDGFRSLLQLTDGWTDSEKKTYLGVKGLNDKIGGLPTAMAFYEYDASGTLGYNKYPTAEVFGINDNIGGMLTAILQGFGDSSGHRVLSLPEISTRTVRLSDQIGTLPSGNFPEFAESEKFFSWLKQPFTYPTSLAELITALYGNSETDRLGVLAAIIAGFPLDTDGDGSFDEDIGLILNHQSAADAKDLAKANTAKIGTVPDGKNLAGMISETDAKIGLLPPDTTVAGMMGTPVVIPKEQTIIPLYDLILWGSNGQLAINPRTWGTIPFPLLGLHDITREVNKIGTLPTEYATVGAALTAMDAKIDARELPSTSADGQYVLSAKKVGDTITYTWVRMDLTSEEQAQ